MSTPLVSVCIGSYNRERYIRETLDSVLAQTYRPLEIIVVDDASTDRTTGIVESYGDQVRLIRLAKNSGLPAVPRNVALRESRGECVAFLDSDDAWLPQKLERQLDLLARHPECGLVHSYAYLMDADSKPLGIRHEGGLPPTGPCFRELLRHCFITMSTVLMRREALIAMGGFLEDPAYRAREDYELFLRVARHAPVGLVPEPLASYRRADTGISQASTAWRALPQDVPAHRLFVDRADLWQGVVDRSEVVDAFVEAALENAQYWRDHGHADRAWWFATEAAKLAPTDARVLAALTKSGVKRWLMPSGGASS